jgi:beta-glucosidase
VLLGVREPGGRLPTTWPDREEDVPVLDTTPVDGVLEYREGLHIGYRAWERAGVTPAYPFGAGQGYTTWELNALTVTDDPDGPSLHVTVRVTNIGQRAGKHVVQGYLARPDSQVERPTVWLAGFSVVRAEAGETVLADLAIDRRAFEHWDPATGSWQLEPGAFELSIGANVADRPLTTEVAP